MLIAETLGLTKANSINNRSMIQCIGDNRIFIAEQRFEQHKTGGKLAARKPYRFGVRLRYDLMKGIGQFTTRREAEAAEKAVADALTRRGHRVFWG